MEFRRNSIAFLLSWFVIIEAIRGAIDAINSSESIKDGETVVSRGGMFELGIFNTGNSRNRYLGIWYKSIPSETVVWVANREAPLTSRSGILRVSESGTLILANESGGIVWSSNTSTSARNPTAQLLDSGNLVVKDADDVNPENFLWQSFDYPSDTYLAGMKLGWNLSTGMEVYLSAWRSDDDPALGEFTFHLDPTGYPQILLKKGKAIQYRFGPWNGVGLSTGGTRNTPILRMNKNEVTYREEKVDPTAVTKFTLSVNGGGNHWTWNYHTSSWIINNMLTDSCDGYDLCGANAICSIGRSPSCGCLRGFKQSATDGCVRMTPLNCREDGFLKYSAIKLPDSRNSSFNNDQRQGLDECRDECFRNCSCMAFTQLDIGGGSGCLFYHGDFLDIRTLAQGGQDLYIRVSVSDLGSKGKTPVMLIAVFPIALLLFLCLIFFIFYTRKRRKQGTTYGPFNADHVKEADLPFLNPSIISEATDHFSVSNKVGQGGFGPVYKGKLEDGQEIAVKCLSKTSSQGVDELKNEVVLIAKLQHRNLVRILGCCIEGEENMLIYEYMPNKSLDLMLFHQTKSLLLDWKNRFHIINGIAKGLLYLHQDSRLRIIHRDLKASNILLDADMNPKISDFGLARCFGGNETEIQTQRVVGTYGYMAPEYAIDGLFSVKSDVFSFGVLVLEIVCGKRNRGFFLEDQNLNLLGHAWTLHKQDRSHELVDPSLGEMFDLSQALRSIHVGLLCMQKCPKERPSMASVVFMLGNEVALPQPNYPAFFTNGDVPAAQSSIAPNSDNQLTITLPHGR